MGVGEGKSPGQPCLQGPPWMPEGPRTDRFLASPSWVRHKSWQRHQRWILQRQNDLLSLCYTWDPGFWDAPSRSSVHLEAEAVPIWFWTQRWDPCTILGLSWDWPMDIGDKLLRESTGIQGKVKFLEPIQQESPWSRTQVIMNLADNCDFWATTFIVLSTGGQSREQGSASGLKRQSLFYAANVQQNPSHAWKQHALPQGNCGFSSWGSAFRGGPARETLSPWSVLSVIEMSDFPSW